MSLNACVCVKLQMNLFLKMCLVNRAAPQSISVSANVYVLLHGKPWPFRGNKGTFWHNDQMEDYQRGIIDLNPPFMILNSE